MDKFPRYARTSAGTVRIVEYLGDGKFSCIGPRDENRVYHRDALSFRRQAPKPNSPKSSNQT